MRDEDSAVKRQDDVCPCGQRVEYVPDGHRSAVNCEADPNDGCRPSVQHMQECGTVLLSCKLTCGFKLVKAEIDQPLASSVGGLCGGGADSKHHVACQAA